MAFVQPENYFKVTTAVKFRISSAEIFLEALVFLFIIITFDIITPCKYLKFVMTSFQELILIIVLDMTN